MSTTFTRFEVQVPLFSDGTPEKAAVDTFLDNIGTLCKFTYNAEFVFTSHDLSGTPPAEYIAIIYGLITTAQQATALGFLNTLNTALGASGPVVCIVSTVTSEP